LDNEDKSSRKTIKVEEFKDPVVKFDIALLPFSSQRKIFGFFKGKELLRLTEVSSSWKIIIENDSELTKKIYENVKLTLKDAITKKDFIALTLNKRPYKHLELNDCFEDEDSIIRRLANCLETLTIKDTIDFQRKLLSGYNFPKLQKFSVSHFGFSWLRWLKRCKFPLLTEFRYVHNHSMFYNKIEMRFCGEHYTEVLNLMPNLKRLYMRVLDYEYIDFYEPKYKLESVDFGNQLPLDFLAMMRPKLKTLHAGGNCADVCGILENLNELETLALNLVDYEEDEEIEEIDLDLSLYPHDSITTLKIDIECGYKFHQIILSLPELRTLICHNYISRPDIYFLGKHRTNLKDIN
jgi:hypothetical protein